jgi:Glycosyl hydrolases family 18
VVRQGRQGRGPVCSWSWDAVESVLLDAELPEVTSPGQMVVTVRAGGRSHLFAVAAERVPAFLSSLRGHAPDLPVERGTTPATGGRSPASPGAPRFLAGLFAALGLRRARRLARTRTRAATLASGFGAVALVGTAAFVVPGGGAAPSGTSDRGAGNDSIMQRMHDEHGRKSLLGLAPATTAPAPSPPALASAPALRPHELFGFAPYWSLPLSSGFDLKDMTTLAYFSVDVNADGSIARSGPGWAGYQSQDLADLITRAHQADDRVVLSATCFDQAALDSVTSGQQAATTLAKSLVQLVEAKNLDGVNLDFEGTGRSDRVGLDRLVATVSATLHSADPHWQFTMDTYASAAGDPGGFYDVGTLSADVDAFFVMAYDMGSRSTPSPTSGLTGSGFTDLDAVREYTSVVPPSKVILGVPYYGYDWPTSGPAQGDPATGAPTPEAYSQIASAGHPVYWDPASQTVWSSYQVGSQWHQTWFDDANSLSLKAQLADSFRLGGMGVWALGMDGGDRAMLAALLGNAPVVKDYQPSPAPTAEGPSPPGTTSSTVAGPAPGSGSSGDGSFSPGQPGAPTTTTTTITSVAAPAPGPSYSYSGTWQGNTVTLKELDQGTSPPRASAAGKLTGFGTDDPAFSCLAAPGAPALDVWSVTGAAGTYVVSAETPGDCATGTWEFVT